ncbi:NAD-dependent epimerase/dehydratase family protein, partial [Candidatus Saccharibacteria bacterium]|nr:NAD-dependent epimerase/dehydratase family protein [Candidatus Saccharibacteria bacterium]
MKVFVTGGAGFIGRHTCKSLLEAGHNVSVYDNLSTSDGSGIPDGVRFIEGDIRDLGATKLAMSGHDAVIHLAAQAIVSESVANPQKSYEINLAGGYNVLVAIHDLGIRTLIYSSTAAAYGNQTKMPVREDAQKLPVNPYGATKLALESLTHAYHSSYGLNVT